MARKPDFQRDRNPLKTLVYCMAVIILLACVAGLYLNSRHGTPGLTSRWPGRRRMRQNM